MKTFVKSIFRIALINIVIISASNFTILFAQTDWALAPQGYGFDSDAGFGTCVDELGNVYVVGQFTDSMDLDPGVGVQVAVSQGSSDIFIQKFDTNGNLIWATSIGSGASDSGTSVAQDPQGNILVCGGFGGSVDFDPGPGVTTLVGNGGFDVFILKLDANGNFIWAKSFGSSSWDLPEDIECDSDGNVYTTGYFSGGFGDAVDFDPGPGTTLRASLGSSDLFLHKLDENGNFLWVNTIGGSDFDRAYGIAIDNLNNPIITGTFEGSLDFDPGPGTYTLQNPSGRNVHVAKFTPSGSLEWAKSFGGTGYNGGFDVACDAQNNIYTTGFFEATADFDPTAGQDIHTSAGDFDIFIHKLSETGDFEWARTYGSADEDYGRSIAVDVNNDVYVTGHFSLTTDFNTLDGALNSLGGTDIFIQKLSASGSSLIANSFGGTGDDRGMCLNLSDPGKIYTTGSFVESGDFDATPGTLQLTAADYRDVYVMKLSLVGKASVGEQELEPSLIFPNPNSGSFDVILDRLSGNDWIEISDQSGRIVFSKEISSEKLHIQLNNIESGIYSLMYTSNRGKTVSKIVIQ